MAEVGRQTAERIRDWGTTSHNTPTLFVGHLSVAGASLGAERMMRVGFDVTVPATCLDGFDAALLGHIHKRQPVWRNAWYCGSPMAHDWSEEGQAKGALVVDVERGILPIVRAVDFPARPVRTIRLRYVASEQYEWPKEWPAGAMVRVIVDAERRPDAAWKARLEREALEAGCHYVRVDVEVRASQKQESGPTTTVGPEERLRSWLREHHVTEGPALEAARQIWQGASR
jgi:DNA repair exonuclease SbcCD nuclease subunit